MKLIVGLGNFGNEYKRTRHNLGFLVIDELEKRWNLSFKEEPSAFYSTLFINEEKIIIAKPKLFMNNSGKVIKGIANYFKVDLNDLIIFVDDKDQDMGSIKIVNKGGHGGQNGIRNIIENFKSNDFLRVKGGIGSDKNIATSSYVLGKWNEEQLKILPNLVSKLADIAEDFVQGKNFNELTNKYNEKK
ncbi:MAG: peptidyl-tRNA hydrolase [Candidatus Tyloplasma litorale]|nr:MAG: peptidyl-tRNA hydrolase [Mycoplasmatales bacterium]